MTVRVAAGDRTIAAGTIRRVLAEYGFGADSIGLVRPLPRVVKNVNVRVRAGGRDWILKCHTPDRVPRLEHSHALELHLADHGLPVAQLQRTTTGATLVHDGGRHYSLHAYVEGHRISLQQRDQLLVRHPQICNEVADLLGRFHTVSHELRRAEIAGGGVDSDALLAVPLQQASRIRRGRTRLTSRVGRLQRKRGRSEYEQWIVDTLPELEHHAEQLARLSISRLVDPSEIVVIHNDVNWENLLFDADHRVVALLDFDNSMIAPRAFDVGAAAPAIAGPDVRQLDEFITAYNAAYGVDADPSLVAVGMRLRCLRSMLWCIDAYLSGVVPDDRTVAPWSLHLYDSWRGLEDRPTRV